MKNLWKLIFLSCFMCNYIVSLVLPLGPRSLSYIRPGPLQEQFTDSWTNAVEVQEETTSDVHEETIHMRRRISDTRKSLL